MPAVITSRHLPFGGSAPSLASTRLDKATTGARKDRRSLLAAAGRRPAHTRFRDMRARNLDDARSVHSRPLCAEGKIMS